MLGTRLAGWCAFVTIVAAINYALRFTAGMPPRDALYRYDTALSGLFVYAVFFAVVVGIAWGLAPRDAFALRRPTSWSLALGLAILILIGIWILSLVVDQFADPGREQGLTPTEWEPSRAGAYVFNGVVVAGVVPAIEELTFRGIGFRLLEPFGRRTAVVGVGLAFGLVHGLVFGLPILVAFGAALAYLRSRTGSVYPGMLVHGFFNALALVLAVTT